MTDRIRIIEDLERNAIPESPRAFRLMEELGTKPKVVYLSRGE